MPDCDAHRPGDALLPAWQVRRRTPEWSQYQEAPRPIARKRQNDSSNDPERPSQ